jgi:hypothetical protein
MSYFGVESRVFLRMARTVPHIPSSPPFPETIMRTHRHAIGAFFVAATLAGCEAADAPSGPASPYFQVEDAGHNDVLHFSSTTPLDETIDSPCNGETIHLTGTLKDEATAVAPPPVSFDHFLHGEHNGVVSESGTGLTTGLAYDFHVTFQDLFNSPSVTAANFEFTSHATGRMTTATPGLSFTIRFQIHGIGLPSGEFKVTKEVDSAECR